jgi:tetratricopeptide (TPR) repeat protein
MKRICLFILFTISYCRAQLPPTRWSWQPEWNTPTPAQQDWVNALTSATAPLPPGAEIVPSEKSVSLARLRHKPPRKAVKSFLLGVKLATAGKWQNGANEFARAAAMDSQFSEAYGNLGASLSEMGQFEQALGNFRRAIELDPATSAHHMNLAYSLLCLGRTREAEPEARTAVALDPSNARAHYLLGVLFSQRFEARSGAIEHLRYAAREVPDAHFILAQLYRLDGDARAAAQEMQQYRKQSADKETR